MGPTSLRINHVDVGQLGITNVNKNYQHNVMLTILSGLLSANSGMVLSLDNARPNTEVSSSQQHFCQSTMTRVFAWSLSNWTSLGPSKTESAFLNHRQFGRTAEGVAAWVEYRAAGNDQKTCMVHAATTHIGNLRQGRTDTRSQCSN